MKLMKLALLMILSLNVKLASADACATCAQLDSVAESLRINASGALEQARHQLETFEFSKARAVRKLEIASFVKLGVIAISKDQSGDSDSFFYNAYLEDKPRFDQAIAALPSHEQNLIKKSLKETGITMRKGNG